MVKEYKNKELVKELKSDINPYNNVPYSFRYNELLEKRKTLPTYSEKENLKKLIEENQILVIEGETGSGKTTQIPQFLIDYGYSKNGKGIICTQPRRVAAISVAKRVAQEMDVNIGEQVGYSVRFEENKSEKTILKYCTEGMLLREMMTDKLLTNYSVVIIDEAHERTVNTDILMGLLKELKEKRNDLKIIIMSATLDAEKFKKYFDAPLIKIPGKMYDVELFYTDTPEADYLESCIKTALYIHCDEKPGDILMFLTGEDEIEYACEKIREEIYSLDDSVGDVLVLPLYSTLPPAEQMKIFNPAPKPNLKNIPGRKIIISTNIAETSLTIDGIVYVIDSGFSKQKTYNPRLRIETLMITPISKANAKQRSGRAGRTKPGKCFRIYTQNSYENEMLDLPYPEMLRTNLNNIILLLKKLYVKNVAKFDFMDPPSPETMMRGLENLIYLEAIDMKGELTELGFKMAELPIDPLLSRTIFASEKRGCIEEIISISALLSVPNIFLKNNNKKALLNNLHSKFRNSEGDHLSLLLVMQTFENQKNKKKFCIDNYLSFKNLSFANEIKKQLGNTIYQKFNIKVSKLELSDKRYNKKILKTLLNGFFCNIAFHEGKGNYIVIKDNQMVLIHPSCMLDKKPEFVMFNETIVTSKNYIRVVSAIKIEWVLKVAPKFFNVDNIKNSTVKKIIKSILEKMEDE